MKVFSLHSITGGSKGKRPDAKGEPNRALNHIGEPGAQPASFSPKHIVGRTALRGPPN